MNTQEYYNAKPSKIANIGLDVSGAKRMNFDTYETDAEREVRERKKALDNGLKVIKEAIKAEVLSDSPNREELINLLREQFQLSYGFSPLSIDGYKEIVSTKRQLAVDRESIAEFNKMIRALNSFKRDVRDLNHDRYAIYWVNKMRKRYAPKASFIEQSGKTFNWKDFNSTGNDIAGKVEYLKTNSNAVQFGNSVSDKERGYILIELVKFLEDWKNIEGLQNIDLKPVAWSFGARGKAGSVAYYQDDKKLISVNRNNIGSLIHEIGHFIDSISGNISRKISYDTVCRYRESIENEVSGKDLRYYCKKEEIFARAFEAYCFKIYAGFSEFAQSGKAFLPELNDDLIAIIKQALKI